MFLKMVFLIGVNKLLIQIFGLCSIAANLANISSLHEKTEAIGVEKVNLQKREYPMILFCD